MSSTKETPLFSEQDYLASLECPTYKARDGRLFVGVILSADEVAPLEAALRGAGKNWAKTQAAMRAVIEACFPRPWWHRIGAHPLWKRVKKLPPPGQMKAIWDFIERQVIALGLSMPSTPGIVAWRATQEIDGPPTAGS